MDNLMAPDAVDLVKLSFGFPYGVGRGFYYNPWACSSNLFSMIET